jgi:hypothetical protein
VSHRNALVLARSAGSTAVVVLLLAFTRPAAAAPQLTSDLELGFAGNGSRAHVWDSTGFLAGLRSNLLFGRNRDVDFGLGPYVEMLTTQGFSDAQVGAGATVLFPVHAYLPLTFSAGLYGRHTGAFGWEPGVAGELFWGSHGYNYDSFYALSAGIFVGGRYGLGDSHEVSLVAGGRIDLELVALPFVVLWQAIRGGNPGR